MVLSASSPGSCIKDMSAVKSVKLVRVAVDDLVHESPPSTYVTSSWLQVIPEQFWMRSVLATVCYLVGDLA